MYNFDFLYLQIYLLKMIYIYIFIKLFFKIKAIYDLYVQCLTEALSKTTFFSNTEMSIYS